MPESIVCDLCGLRVLRHASYVVRMDVYADPSMPELDTETLAETDFNQAMSEILSETETMTADDLQDGVHRRFEYALCPPCQKSFLANPLGMPRSVRTGRN